MSNPTIDMRCVTCGMPLAEGPLMDTPDGKKCQECFSQDPKNMVCDFCRADSPAWVYTGDDMMAAEVVRIDPFIVAVPVLNLSGGWAACQACHEDVQTLRIDRLVQRLFENNPPTMDQLRQDLVVTMTYFFQTILENIRDPRRID